MRANELINALQELPSNSRVVIRFSDGQDLEIAGVTANDVVPDDVKERPEGRIINGIIAILADGRDVVQGEKR